MSATPPAAVIIRHTCADFDRWKAAFDADEPNRKAAGMLGHHINRGADNPNDLSVYIAASDLAKAQAFANSPQLKETMQKAGIVSAPVVTWMTPVSEQIVWDRQVPGVLITHTVADFAKWQVGYAQAEGVRKAGGIIGHAVNRAVDNPNLVIVYHQAESQDALKAFTSHPELKAAMLAAGVTSAPTFTFVTGGWAKMY
ncbi:MAG: antibiotic biosynthesis monooxygenase [Gemmatimonadetes bacterium]|nr:antibiotic biosynthesis monooxygenase [Gemmatimonadota bacterium]